MKPVKTKMKAYSLVEVLVTLAIFGIMVAMLSQAILLNINVTRKAFARARVREEISEISGLIERDIRNSTLVSVCEADTTKNPVENRCTFSHTATFTWTDNCPALGNGPTGVAIKSICKKDVNQGIQYESSNFITLVSLSFQNVAITGTDATKSTILVTLIFSATNPDYKITNQIRQFAVSTRNFTI